MAAAAAKTANRTAPSSGATVFLSQAYVPPPRPPQRGKQKRPAQQSFPGPVGCEEAGDLGDGEDEDEVKAA
jgi:hypothetical protein